MWGPASDNKSSGFGLPDIPICILCFVLLLFQINQKIRMGPRICCWRVVQRWSASSRCYKQVSQPGCRTPFFFLRGPLQGSHKVDDLSPLHRQLLQGGRGLSSFLLLNCWPVAGKLPGTMSFKVAVWSDEIPMELDMDIINRKKWIPSSIK